MTFRLLETMRVMPDGEVFLLDRHMKRLRGSALHFSFQCEIGELRQAVLSHASEVAGPSWLRLTLSRNGEYELDSGPLQPHIPRFVKLASFRLNSENPFLHHKTTNREIYDAAKREGDADTEVLLVNERGEITEITIANVAVLRQGQWITPRLSCGLLDGVMRSELLANGQIAEAVIHSHELRSGETIRCFNALRGVFDAVLAENKLTHLGVITF